MRYSTHRSRASKRGGAVLVLFALLVFGLMGLAALVIDLGLASSTQGQMQAAVDGAVLEAMRMRNTTHDGVPDYLVDEVFVTEEFRRANAAEFIRLVFDDDLDPAVDLVGYSVGPVFNLSGGFGEADASALIQYDANSELDDPVLLSNESFVSGYNANSGDMVAGTYSSDQPHYEPGDYQRADFARAPHVSAASRADAFLIRMRRTGEDPIAGALSSGPTIPYLFGRGSLIGAGDDYSPRKDGIAVRATAISTVQPALSVGVGVPSETPGERPLRGVVPFALALSNWNSLSTTLNDPKCLDLLASGVLQIDGVSIGSFVEPVTTVGQLIVPIPLQMDPSLLPLPIEGWVPIYDDINGSQRVVGFGYVDMEEPTSCNPDQFSFSKRASVVASHNASCVFPHQAESLSKSDWDLIFQRRRLVSEPLLASAISR